MQLRIPLLFLFIAAILCGCQKSEVSNRLDHAESIMEERPDSALTILKKIDSKTLYGKTKARHALLLSMALDKNYLDKTTFEILQPAINYYNNHDNNTLRTYYYQGCIFQNKGDVYGALNMFTKGIDISHECDDSLTIARTFVAMACSYQELYDFENYSKSYLEAARVFNSLSHKNEEFECLLNALNGYILLRGKERADSIINRCDFIENIGNDLDYQYLDYKLSYTLEFGTEKEIQDVIYATADSVIHTPGAAMNLALANQRIGNYEEAKHLLKLVNASGGEYDTLKYQAISVLIYKNEEDFKNAFLAHLDFSRRLDSINAYKFEQESSHIEERHKIELQTQRKSQIIEGCLWGIACLALIVIILLLLVRSNHIKRRLALREAENLAHRVDTLEAESESLRNIIDAKEKLPMEVQQAIQVRIEMLNSLLAGYITANCQYEKPYETWVKELTDNTDEFMNSTRLAFQASHPRFIKYFVDHNLSVNEINYVCLYAIGLRGKEVGVYMKRRSHVNISSNIRKKLGIDRHETNIGIYVRRLLKSL